MTTRDIRKRAEAMGLKIDSDNKADLIRAIQAAEGNPQCYHSGQTSCDQTACCWLEDCIPEQWAKQHQTTGIGARLGRWRR